jgi:hypothetical protein
MLLVEVVQAREVATAAKAVYVVVVLVVETSAQEATVARDSATLCVEDA